MHVINARNVNDALTQGLALIRAHGVEEPSRNGPVLRVPVPVTTVYAQPNERVLLHAWRDANPFFHLVEALWCIAGRDDLKALTPYVKGMAAYSDDGGVTQPGAYGRRWRRHFWSPNSGQASFDQLNWVVKRLRDNTADRRTVIQMWDGNYDPHAADDNSADVPCNLTALPWVSGGALHLTVFCRSNDMLWGAHGANAVHFSFLLEYLAARLGLPVGTLTQVSNNYHLYAERAPMVPEDVAAWVDPYALGTGMELYPIFMDFTYNQADLKTPDDDYRERICQEDLLLLFEHGPHEAGTKARWPFIRQVAVPMMLAHEAWRKGKGIDRYDAAFEALYQCQAPDWRWAGLDWLTRRRELYLRAHDDGPAYEPALPMGQP